MLPPVFSRPFVAGLAFGLVGLADRTHGQPLIESNGGFVVSGGVSSVGPYSTQAAIGSGSGSDQVFSNSYFARSGESAPLENEPFFSADPVSLVGDGGDVLTIDYATLVEQVAAQDSDFDSLALFVQASSGVLSFDGSEVEELFLQSEESFTWELPSLVVDPNPNLTVTLYDGVFESLSVSEVGVQSASATDFSVATEAGTVSDGADSDLGEAEVDVSSTEETYVITNGTVVSGDLFAAAANEEDLVISEIEIAGSHPDDFSITGVTLPLTLAPGESATFVVQFGPRHHGQRQAQINIYRLGADQSLFGFGVSGRGNRPPTGGDDEVSRPVGLAPVKIFLSDLLANDFDIDGDPVEFGGFVTELSAQGRSLERLGDEWIVYHPGAEDEDPDDSFVYHVSDGRGAMAPSVVWIREGSGGGIAENLETGIEALSGGGVLLRFRGIPGRLYQTQYTEAFSGEQTIWVDLGDPAIARTTNGSIEVEDTSVGASARFYRLIEVSTE